MLANVTPSNRVEIAEEIQDDIKRFIELINDDRPDLKNLGVSNATFDELMGILEDTYLRTSEAF